MARTFEVYALEAREWVDEVSIATEFVAVCPIPSLPKPYAGWVKITYVPLKHLVELDSFASWVDTLGVDPPMSLEELTQTIFSVFMGKVQPYKVQVTCAAAPFRHVQAKCTVTGGHSDETKERA